MTGHAGLDGDSQQLIARNVFDERRSRQQQQCPPPCPPLTLSAQYKESRPRPKRVEHYLVPQASRFGPNSQKQNTTHRETHLQERGDDDHRAPQQLVVADGGEEEADLRHARSSQVEDGRDHQPPQHAARDLGGAVGRRLELLLGVSWALGVVGRGVCAACLMRRMGVCCREYVERYVCVCDRCATSGSDTSTPQKRERNQMYTFPSHRKAR